jgi:hypothetical protein
MEFPQKHGISIFRSGWPGDTAVLDGDWMATGWRLDGVQ